jgi:hypothetical protein
MITGEIEGKSENDMSLVELGWDNNFCYREPSVTNKEAEVRERSRGARMRHATRDDGFPDEARFCAPATGRLGSHVARKLSCTILSRLPAGSFENSIEESCCAQTVRRTYGIARLVGAFARCLDSACCNHCTRLMSSNRI